jgi:glutamate synthase (NADPH/NADH) small chain
MSQKRMLSFVSVEQETPDKRDAAERRGDFHEIYADFIAAKADEQASRCSQCGVPFCQTHCPLGNNIPDWLMLTADGAARRSLRNLRRHQRTCPKSAAASARRTGCAKAAA